MILDVRGLKLLDTVKINGRHFDPEVRRILDVARITAPKMRGDVVWVTSAADGKHKSYSRHFTNEAFDIRIRNVKGLKREGGNYVFDPKVAAWAKRIKFELGDDYDVVYGDKLHLDHIHCEYDPKN